MRDWYSSHARWLGGTLVFGLIFAFLLFGELRDRVRLSAAAGGAAIAFLLMPFTPAGVPVVAAACAALIGLKHTRTTAAT